MPPPIPYIVSGTVYKGPFEATSNLSGTVGTGGGQTLNIYLGGSTEPASGVVVTLVHTNGTLTTTTDSNGAYSINIGNLTSYIQGDSFTISASTVSSDNLDDTNVLNGVRPVKLIDDDGEAYTSKYPIPVQLANDLIPNQNASLSMTYSGTNLTQVDMAIDGTTYRKTFTYDGSNNLLTSTRWAKQ